MTLCKASASFNIPKGTISNKLNKKVPLERKMGPKTYLSNEEEIRIKNWILAKSAVGFPFRPERLCSKCIETVYLPVIHLSLMLGLVLNGSIYFYIVTKKLGKEMLKLYQKQGLW